MSPIRITASLALLLALAACGGGPRTGSAHSLADLDEGWEQQATLPPVPGQPKKPAPLTGMTLVEVRELLGEPGFTRRDGPAQVWQYFGNECVLDLFLYEEKDGVRVAHSALRGLGPGQPPPQGCLAGLKKGDES